MAPKIANLIISISALKTRKGLIAAITVCLLVLCGFLIQTGQYRPPKPATVTEKEEGMWTWAKVKIDEVTLGLHAERSNSTQRRLPVPSIIMNVIGVGGLGNQLFWFACSYALARDLNFPLYVRLPDGIANATSRYDPADRSFVLDLFNITFSHRVTSSLTTTNLIGLSDHDILTHTYEFTPDLDQHRLGTAGYCQIESVFSRYREELVKLLKVRKEFLSSKYSGMSEKIRQSNCSICLHIRRGDYFTYRTPVSFYYEARKKMDDILRRRNVRNCLFREDKKSFLFSDNSFKALEKEFGEDYFQTLQPFELVSGQGLSNVEEFQLMSECDHNIIAASTFGWWAAYLNKNKGKVVIAAQYPPKTFEVNGKTNTFLFWQYSYIYFPGDWVVIDPFRKQRVGV